MVAKFSCAGGELDGSDSSPLYRSSIWNLKQKYICCTIGPKEPRNIIYYNQELMTPKVEIHLSKVKAIDNRKKEVSTKLWYSTIGRFGNALAVFFLRRRVRLRSCAFYFHCIIEKWCTKLERTYHRNISKWPTISSQNKYIELRILTRSQHNFVLIYLFVNTGKSKIVNK